ncbi:MAG: hypothetical protein O9346_08920 [Leptospiraceae bacterium]|nr:hypothetical protein [Leptospiraceae bacterium]MCZ8346524.1 hypothetical protein [Leptospiraceae bacterium]
MNKIMLIFVSGMLLTLTQCTTLGKDIPGTGTQNVKNNFKIGPATTGEGCATQFLIFTFSDSDRKYASLPIEDYSLSFASNKAKSIALYNAISKVEKADALVSPIFEQDIKVYPFITKICAKVKARTVILN